MQTIKFTKMQGAGNDYVYVDCTKSMIDDISETAKRISDRHFGIGSDGLVLICASDRADFRMQMYNADGTQAEMCGNASRCIAKYVHDRGLTDKTTITLETLAGVLTLKMNLLGGSVDTVCVNMGEPRLVPKDIPINSGKERFIEEEIIVDGDKYKVTGVSMGNPHAVTVVEDTDNINIERIGPKFENHELFPRRINTEFAQIIDRNTIKMRVWERGAGETLACGTGACATLVAMSLAGYTGREADLLLLGGKLHIKWDENDNCVYMTGPARFVFDGEITL